MVNQPVDWSYLPIELLTEISNRLNDRLHVLCFRAVCRSWRAAAAFPIYPNGALLSPILPHKDPSTHCSYFTANYVYLFEPTDQTATSSSSNGDGSPKFWLAMVDEINPGRLYLRDPLSRYPVEKLPDFFPKMLGSVHLRVTEVHRSFTYTNAMPRPSGYEYWNNDRVEKVLFFENHRTFARLCYDGRLELYTMDDEKWVTVHYGGGLQIEDIVSFKGDIFWVDNRGRGAIVDVNSRRLYMHITALPSPRLSGRRKRLVEANGDVYLVVMHNSREKGMFTLRIYKMNEEKRRWVAVSNLGDLGLFVGSDCSFALSSKQCAGFPGNCVYVFKNGFRGYKGEEDDHKNAMLHRESANFQIGRFRLDGGASIGTASFYGMLWPPPSWVYES